MKLLLVNPKHPESFWSFRWAIEDVLPGKRAVNPPLGLATLAALTPRGWQVEIVDENIESVPLDPDADVVGVCGMGVQFARQMELLAYYRRIGRHTVAGGSFASLCPERYAGIAHSVVAGEAEYLWPRFCADFERGRAQPLYRETGSVALSDSPVPRFDLLQLAKYSTATLQFSRGCPYLCEFCDIIVMFGRKPRHKSLAQVERELDALRAAGAFNVFFVDDNMIGNRAVAKELLRSLIEYQERRGFPFSFGTEVSINLAQDRELLELFREANFGWVFIGIESADPQALKEARKSQNMREDTLTALRRIYSYGIDVLAGFIVGFDQDTVQTFETQYRFIVESGVQAAMVGLLTALPRTPLHERLEKEGRLRPLANDSDNTKPATNIVPKNMSYGELVSGYEALYHRLTRDRAIAERVRNKLSCMPRPVYRGEYPLGQRITIVSRLLRRVAQGGWLRAGWFLRSLPLASPSKLPLAMMDWVAGLSMRDYVERHFAPADEPRVAEALFSAIMRAAGSRLSPGSITLQRAAAAFELSICVRDGLPGPFFRRSARHLERLLAKTRATLTLKIESLRDSQAPQLERLLARLKRHGDRVSIVLDRRLRRTVMIDSSVFNLVLR